MRKTKEEAEATRQAILQSAMDTFYEKGYSKTTFDEIAKRINLTKGAVYWHFRNKPDLIAAIINDYFEKQKSYIAERQPVIQSFDDIINYFLHHSNFMLSNENNYKVGFFLICQMEWSEAIITKVKPQVAKNKEYWFMKIQESLLWLQSQGEIDKNVDVNILSHIIISSWGGIMDAVLSKRCNVSVEVMIRESLNLIFNGLKMERMENASK